MEKPWRGPCYLDHGTNNARGVAILISPELNINITKVKYSGEGRYIILQGEIDGKTVVLVNLYAQNGQNFHFSLPLLDKISSFSSDLCIVVGDLNVHLNPELDKKGSNTCTLTRGADLINMFLDENDWLDVWRAFNPDKFHFTYRRKTPHIMTRIDYFLLPMSTFYFVDNCEIIPGFQSDHSFVELTFKLERTMRGRGLWKLNTTLLGDKFYIEGSI